MADIFAPISKENSSVEDARRSVTYHPSIWRDHFLAYTSDITEITIDERKQHEILKEKVKNLLAETPNYGTAKIMLIDAIQRLGVEYHFEKEINESLRQIHEQSSKDNEDGDVCVVALRFRLLRQQGYRVSCDMFKKFIDDDGNFKDSLRKDVKGMISLYEASNFGLHGEGILDKALEFSSSHLESLGALEMPISMSWVRLGVKKSMSVYQEDDTCNQDLLHFAKLDFNIVQKAHQGELNYVTRWWDNLDFATKLPFARDRVVECYFWILAVYFEPHYNTARIFLTKIIAMTSIVDDIYDVYGTLDELRRFTEIIPSWDLSAADELPSYMRIFYEALLGVYSEMEDEMGKYGQSYRVQYAKQEMTKLVKAYMEEAEWCYSKYIPRNMDEYMKVGLVTGAYMMLSTASLVGMGDEITKHDLDWIANEPKIVVASSMLGRLIDDIAGHGKEEKVTAVSCYMNEYGCPEKEALAKLSKQLKDAWKDLYEECVEPRAAPTYILERVVNLSRILCLMYVGDDDGYTNSTTRLKHFIQLLLVDPIH